MDLWLKVSQCSEPLPTDKLIIKRSFSSNLKVYFRDIVQIYGPKQVFRSIGLFFLMCMQCHKKCRVLRKFNGIFVVSFTKNVLNIKFCIVFTWI